MGQSPSSIERPEVGSQRSRYANPRRQRPRRSHSVPSPCYDSFPSGNSKESSIYKAFRKRFLGGRVPGATSPKLIGSSNGKNPVSHIFHHGGVRGKAAKDHAKVFRELVSGWSTQDLHCLVVEYEASAALQELSWRADTAHCHAGTLKEDLSALFEQKQCSDVTLIYDGHEFAVHSAFLRHRSGFFRELLANVRTGDRVLVKLPRKFVPISGSTFRLLLQYLYTGEISTEARAGVGNEIELILRLKEEFGCPHTLDHDAYAMLEEVNVTGDALLVFVSNSTPLPPPSPVESENEDTTGTLTHPPREEAAAAASPEVEDGTVPAGDDLNIWRQGLQELPRDSRGPSRSRPVSLASSGTPSHQRHCEFRCHSAVLAARSPFFRSLIQKRLAEREKRDDTVWSSQTVPEPPIQILLDESVIPRIYAPVLLHALYTDQVDLSQVIRGYPVSVNSLSEVQAIASGKCQVSPIDEATEIYQIARFLELEGLAQGCENIVAQHTSAECLPSVFNWSVESYGSPFVRRQCVNFLCKEFARVAASPLLFDLEEALLAETLRSDFVQASELEILQAVIRWGEHQLIRRLEEREPNVLSGTTHSITRKGIRRSDLSDEELKEILANLMPLVRTDYILPPFHQALIQASSRGLISSPPADLPGPSILYTAAEVGEVSHPDRHWLHPHTSNCGPLAHRLTPRPRFFLPYFKEARTQLEKRLADGPEQKLLAHSAGLTRHASDATFLPDTLYMVRSRRHHLTAQSGPLELMISELERGSLESVTRVGVEDEYSLPEFHVLDGIRAKITAYLRTSATVQKGLACGCHYHRKAVLTQVCLRAVREAGCPDSAIRFLHNAERPSSSAEPESPARSGRRFVSEPDLGEMGLGPLDLPSGYKPEAWPDLMSSVLDQEDSAGGALHETCEYVSWWSAQASAALSDPEQSFEQQEKSTTDATL